MKLYGAPGFSSLADRMEGDYLFGDAFTVADAYLFAMARGASGIGFDLPAPLLEYIQRVDARPAVQAALQHEAA
jgi:glutathione S-transferase